MQASRAAAHTALQRAAHAVGARTGDRLGELRPCDSLLLHGHRPLSPRSSGAGPHGARQRSPPQQHYSWMDGQLSNRRAQQSGGGGGRSTDGVEVRSADARSCARSSCVKACSCARPTMSLVADPEALFRRQIDCETASAPASHTEPQPQPGPLCSQQDSRGCTARQGLPAQVWQGLARSCVACACGGIGSLPAPAVRARRHAHTRTHTPVIARTHARTRPRAFRHLSALPRLN